MPFLRPGVSTSNIETRSSEDLNTEQSTTWVHTDHFSNKVQYFGRNPKSGGNVVIGRTVQQVANSERITSAGVVNKVQQTIGNISNHVGTTKSYCFLRSSAP